MMKEWEMLSKAFSKSMSSNSPALFLFLAYSSMSYVFLTTSPINLPDTNPFWSVCMIESRAGFNLSVRAPLKILYTWFNKDIGRQFAFVFIRFWEKD